MARAAAEQPTGMTAVLGGDEAAVLDAIEALGLTPANLNGAGQIVAAGTLDQLEKFAAEPPAGARLRPLQVAGAFHTEHMAPAVDALRAAAATRCGQRPGRAAAIQPGRGRGALRRGLAGAGRHPGQRAGAVGPVHARRWPGSA